VWGTPRLAITPHHTTAAVAITLSPHSPTAVAITLPPHALTAAVIALPYAHTQPPWRLRFRAPHSTTVAMALQAASHQVLSSA